MDPTFGSAVRRVTGRDTNRIMSGASLALLGVKFFENILQFISSVLILHNCTSTLLDIDVKKM